MVAILGAAQALDVLDTLPLVAAHLPPRAYAAFARAAATQTDRAAAVNSMVDVVGAYMWTQKPTPIPPQIVRLAAAEAGAEDPNYARVVRLDSRAPGVDVSVPLPLCVEDPKAHWGLVFDAHALCRVCCVPIRAIAPASAAAGPGLGEHRLRRIAPKRSPAALLNPIVAYPCGHVFHDACVGGEDGCVTCFSADFVLS
jgi:hypothetical protein